jgi:hypothetical protein
VEKAAEGVVADAPQPELAIKIKPLRAMMEANSEAKSDSTLTADQSINAVPNSAAPSHSDALDIPSVDLLLAELNRSIVRHRVQNGSTEHVFGSFGVQNFPEKLYFWHQTCCPVTF